MWLCLWLRWFLSFGSIRPSSSRPTSRRVLASMTATVVVVVADVMVMLL